MPSIHLVRATLTAPFSAFALLAIVSSLARASESANDSPDAAYTVFLGLDLTLERERTDCPVVDAEGDSITVLKDGGVIRIRHQEGSYKSAFSPHVGRSHLEIGHVRTRRIDSRSDARARDAMSQMILMDVLHSERQQAAEDNMRQSDARAGLEQAKAAGGFTNNAAEAGVAAATAADAMNNAFGAPTFASALPGAGLAPEEDTGAGGLFDSYEVNFEISGPIDVNDAYGIVRMLVRDSTNRDRHLPFIKFFDVGRLGPKSRRFTVVVKDLPQGFAVESYAVHILVKGREIPTNLSKNSVSVTEDEAHQFLILQYLQQNRKSSLPVAVIPELLPAGLRTLVGADQMNATVDLTINREGHVTAIQATGIPTALSPELETAVRRVRFFPALVAGTATDGRGTFALSELAR